ALKPLLKPEATRARVFREAATLRKRQIDTGTPMPVLDIIRALSAAAPPPKKSGSPKRSGSVQTILSSIGKAVLRIERADRKGIRLTLLHKSGASREDAEKAIREVLDQHWT
ncbi:MAG: replication protein B, partial [Oxalobacteraceae bacterium]